MMKIALDAMGGDKAPGINVIGARDALALYPRIEELLLVGDEVALGGRAVAHQGRFLLIGGSGTTTMLSRDRKILPAA